MKLSILIPTLPERSKMLDRLMYILNLQKSSEFEVLTDYRNYPTGAKRNNLLKKARGEYVVFIDDDDTVPDYYIDQVFKALEQKPDVVGFCLYQYRDYNLVAVSKNSTQHEFWYEHTEVISNCQVIIYHRTPTHLNPVKRNIACQVGFTEQTIGEDKYYINNIRPLIRSEYYISINPEKMIDLPMYFYLENEGKKVLDQLR